MFVTRTGVAGDPAAVGGHREGPMWGSSGQRPDSAARLRDAFQDGSGQATISRGDAMGAAAEIDQLWAAFWIMEGRANNDSGSSG
jgi:hypothetical protein